MMDNLIQQFAGGGAESLTGPALHQSVDQMVQNAGSAHMGESVQGALQNLGPSGFGQSIEQAAVSGGSQQSGGIAGLLMGAIERGGGSPTEALSQIGRQGQDPQNLDPQQLGKLGEYVHANHPDALAGMLGDQLSGGGGSTGMLHLLGNPMVRNIGMQLAQKLM